MKRLVLPTCRETAVFGMTLILSAMLVFVTGCVHRPKEYEVDEQGALLELADQTSTG